MPEAGLMMAEVRRMTPMAGLKTPVVVRKTYVSSRTKDTRSYKDSAGFWTDDAGSSTYDGSRICNTGSLTNCPSRRMTPPVDSQMTPLVGIP